jgi:hypothetical protein
MLLHLTTAMQFANIACGTQVAVGTRTIWQTRATGQTGMASDASAEGQGFCKSPSCVSAERFDQPSVLVAAASACRGRPAIACAAVWLPAEGSLTFGPHSRCLI